MYDLGDTYGCGGIGRAGNGQSGSSWNDAGRIEKTRASAAQASIVGVLGDASWDRNSGLTTENDLRRSSDGPTKKSANDQLRNCGLDTYATSVTTSVTVASMVSVPPGTVMVTSAAPAPR